MGIQIGTTDITDIGKIKYGNTDIQEVFVGRDKVWPIHVVPAGAEVEIKLVPGLTGFGFKTNSEFEVEQDGTTVTHPAAPTGVTITGMNDGSFIKIKVTNDAPDTTFSFNRVDHILHVKLNSVGKMTSLSKTFVFLLSMTTFECDADTSGVMDFSATWADCEELTSFPAIDTSSGTDFGFAWSGCRGLTSFPALDVSSGTDFGSTWSGCANLACFAGTLDFRKLTDGASAFVSCNVLAAPATIGTPVRSGDKATAGIWTNPNPCP